MGFSKKAQEFPVQWRGLIVTALIFFIATALSYIISELTVDVAAQTGANTIVVLLYILAIILTSLFTDGYFYGIIISVISVFAINFFFTYPFWAFNFTISGYPITFIFLLIVSVITSTLTARVKKQVKLALVREKQTNTLYLITKKLLSSKGTETILSDTKEYLEAIFGCEAVIYDREPPSEAENSAQTDDSRAASRCYTSGEESGRGTECFGNALGIYLPIQTEHEILGVAGLYSPAGINLTEEQFIIFRMIISQAAMALERQKLADEQRQIMIESETEKMRSNLLRAISHDLRTPLTGISGSSSAIIENFDRFDKATLLKLASDINEDSQWLIRMVENLLSVTKISDETAKVKKTPEAVEEIAAEAIGRIRARYPNSSIHIKVPDELLIVPMDATLIEQVILNLVENSIIHSGSREPVEINIRKENERAVFEISDKGKGIPAELLPQLFHNTIHAGDSSRGMGIGLSICRSIVNAHGGEISAHNIPSGGAMFTFTLPVGENTEIQ